MNTRTVVGFITGALATAGLLVPIIVGLTVTATPVAVGLGPFRILDSTVADETVTVEAGIGAYLAIVLVGALNAAVARRVSQEELTN